MGLLRPTPGEIVDRLSILCIKIAKAKEKLLLTAAYNFQYEQSDLERELAKHVREVKHPPLRFPSPKMNFNDDAYEAATKELANVNQQLWGLEDEIRVLHKESPKRVERVVEVSELIVTLNNTRSKLVVDINTVFGVTAKEKLHD